jgi:pilus assembly protein CpaE
MQTVVTSSNVLLPTCLKLRQALCAQLKGAAPAMIQLANLEERLLHIRPDVLAIDLSGDAEAALAALPRVRGLVAGAILAVGPVAEPRLILRALNAGADQYVDEYELETSLEAALRRLQNRDDTATDEGRLTVVLACAGGSGASTVATNLAVLLAGEFQKAVLIDLKPGANDLAALLDLKPNHTLADLCTNAQRMDQGMFENCLVRHASGVHLLAAPQKFRDISMVTPAALSQGVKLARALFPQVVVDLQDCYHEEQIVALRQADRVLLVLRLDFTSLRNARRILQQLDAANVSRMRLELIANRTGQASELPAAQAETALGMKIAYQIPDDSKTVNQCNNVGVPLVSEAPTSKIAKALVRIARAGGQPTAPDGPAGKAATTTMPAEPLSLTARLQMLFG